MSYHFRYQICPRIPYPRTQSSRPSENDSPWRGFESEGKQYVDARHLLLLVHLIATLGTLLVLVLVVVLVLLLVLLLLPPFRGRLMVLVLTVGQTDVADHFLVG